MSKQQEYPLLYPVKNEGARKRLGFNNGFYWKTEDSLARAILRANVALIDAGFSLEDFKKPIRVNFPVENDIPPEGVFDTTFCNNRELGGEDGKTLVLISGTGELSQENPQPKSWPELTEVAKLPLRQRIVAQLMAEDDYLYHADKEQMTEILCLESDSQNTFAQTFMLAAENVEQIENAVGFDIFRAAKAYKQLFPVDGKKPELATVTQFLTDYFGADCINRAMVVSEWAERLQNKLTPDAKPAGPFVDFDKLLTELQNAVLVKFGVCENVNDDMVADAHDLLQKDMATFDGHIVEAIGRTPEINAMYPERKLFAIGWVKHKCKTSAKWPEVQAELRNWKKRQDAERKDTGPSKSVIDIARARAERQENHQNTENVATNINPTSAAVRREYKQTWKTLDLKTAVAFWPGDVIPGSVDGKILRWAKAEVIEKDREDWKRFSAALRTIGNILEYDDETIFHLVQMRPVDIHKDPVALKNYITEFLATHAQPDSFQPEVASEQPQTGSVNEEGKSDDEEKPQSSVLLADEPATPETVEPDTTEHHQDPQPLDVEPQVDTVDAAYQEKLAELHEARENIPPKNLVDVDKLLAVTRGEYVEGISVPNDPKWIHEDYRGTTASNEGEKPEEINTQETAGDSLQEDNEGAQSDTGCGDAGDASDTVRLSWFEPGRYEAIPNEVYHSANGISSTMLKDARISLMYYHGRHIARTIPREESDALLRGRIIHGYVLETDKFADEYAVPSPVPDSVVTTSQELVAIIKKYNAALPALMTPEQMREWIEIYNSTLTQPMSLGNSAEETGTLYGSLPESFKRIPAEEKHTASAMKACIKEYNATLPPLLKTSGTREQLLDQIATVDPTLAENERAKFLPYNVSGTKEQLTEIVREIRPDVVTIEDWQKQQEAANRGKTLITVDMYEQAKNIHAALQNNPDAARLLNHPERKSEISYFGFDEETGLEIRVRPDIEIRLPYESICADLKSVSLGYVRQERLKDRLHREIIERDYHLSAAMYCDVANLDKFFWIFVNKDAGYHWVAVVEASPELLELGRQEYRRTLRQINQALETNHWPAPITESYTDELNDFDLRRLEALSI